MPVSIDSVKKLLEDSFDEENIKLVIDTVDKALSDQEFVRNHKEGSAREGFQWNITVRVKLSKKEIDHIEKQYRLQKWNCSIVQRPSSEDTEARGHEVNVQMTMPPSQTIHRSNNHG